MKALGGEISVESVLGRGTTFRLVLPPARDGAQAVRPFERYESRPYASRQRLLLIDDDVNVARGLERIFVAEHDVVVAGSGREALAILARGDRFDVILCDLMMPDVTGMDLFAHVEIEHPQLAEKMVFVTGGAFTADARSFLERVPNPRLEKAVRHWPLARDHPQPRTRLSQMQDGGGIDRRRCCRGA